MGNLAVSRAFGDAEFKKNISYGVQHDSDATANSTSGGSSSNSTSGGSSSTSPDSNEPSVCGPLVIAEPVSLFVQLIELSDSFATYRLIGVIVSMLLSAIVWYQCYRLHQ
jgi:hypothetical protein